jgi:hypothetical protein
MSGRVVGDDLWPLAMKRTRRGKRIKGREILGLCQMMLLLLLLLLVVVGSVLGEASKEEDESVW